MSFYKKNLQFIRQTNPVLYKLVTATKSLHAAETKIFVKENNALVKTDKGQCFLHSLYDRNREVTKLCTKIPDNPQAIVLFGSGMGDAVLHINKQFSDLEHLIIVEPNQDVFKALLTQLDLISLFKNCEKISFLVNLSLNDTSASLHEVFDQGLYQKISFIAPLAYRTLYQSYYQSVLELSQKAIRRKVINMATRSITNYKWIVNQWRNQKILSIPFETLANRIPAPPVIIVSAGPSLNKNMHLLNEAKGKAIIIAVGSAISILNTHGIIPHFRMAFDASEANRNLFANVATANCPLIYGNALYHEILPKYQGKKIKIILNTDPLGQYFCKKQTRPPLLIRSGHSIANVALDLACKWGSRKIILMGQDLCYTNEKLHASGSWDDELNLVEATKKNWLPTTDIYGQNVYTDKPFLSMKAIFEELLAYHPHIQCINASEGGLPIDGTINKPLRQVLDEDLSQSTDFTALIEQVLSSENPAEEQRKVLEVIASTAETELTEITAINELQFSLLAEANSMRDRQIFAERILKTLKKLESLFKKLNRIDYYTVVIAPNLADTYQMLERRFTYNGNDSNLQLEAVLQMNTGKAEALKLFTGLSRDLVLECQRKKVLNIVYK